jgi:hypothetical protein
MYKERLRDEISDLIEKIRMDWSRIKSQSPGIHKIDKDIITNDIRSLYDLIYEIDFDKPERKTPAKSESSYLESTVTVQKTEVQPPTYNTQNTHPAPTRPIPVKEIPSQNNQTDEIEVVLKPAVVESEIINKPVEAQSIQQHENNWPDYKTESEKQQTSQPKNPVKSTIDLFTAPKTIAEVFQNANDNSFAARMAKNPITDIKTAIGINEKFLFINTIFEGEISLYNKAIERLNQLPDYYLALHFIEELKANYERETNKDSFAKLMEIVKRKYL